MGFPPLSMIRGLKEHGGRQGWNGADVAPAQILPPRGQVLFTQRKIGPTGNIGPTIEIALQ